MPTKDEMDAALTTVITPQADAAQVSAARHTLRAGFAELARLQKRNADLEAFFDLHQGWNLRATSQYFAALGKSLGDDHYNMKRDYAGELIALLAQQMESARRIMATLMLAHGHLPSPDGVIYCPLTDRHATPADAQECIIGQMETWVEAHPHPLPEILLGQNEPGA